VKVSKQVAEGCSLLADFSFLKIEAIRSSETSVNPGATQHHVLEDDILHSHRCGNLISYKTWFVLLLTTTPSNID
jgi:hypothetical protein